MNAFVQQQGDRVIGSLKGWDRVRIRGSLLWLAHPKGLAAHLLRSGRKLTDFAAYAQWCTVRVGRAIEEVGTHRPSIFLRRGGSDKEELAREIAQRDGIKEGLICTLRATENCQSFGLVNGQDGMPRISSIPRRCNHYYQYLIHPVFGFMHLRLQSWLPFTVHICLNGREWLSRQLEAAGIKYLRKENCFPWIQDLPVAQELMNQQVDFQWKPPLDQLLAELNPTLAELLRPGRVEYYWSMEESEWANDTLFCSEPELSRLYPSLTRRAIETFGTRDVLRFLGQKVPATGNAHHRDYREMLSTYKQRPEGVCIKHRLGKNSLKCYNKQGTVLRVETTINDPKQFKVPRREEDGQVKWMSMRKGVVDARRRAEVSDKATERYLEALAAVQTPTPLKLLAQELSKAVRWKGQQVRGLNLFAEKDARLLQTVGRGEFLINGLRNRDLQAALWSPAAEDEVEKRRRSGQVTRGLRMLRAHGLIEKVPKSHRYLVTSKGQQVIAALAAAGNADIAQLTKAA
jgi:hypothetical protein